MEDQGSKQEHFKTESDPQVVYCANLDLGKIF